MDGEGSIPIYFINLDSQPARRAFMEGQFNDLGLRGRRIEAVSATTIPNETAALYCDRAKYQCVSKSELACTLSHLTTLQAFVATGAPYGVVLEDDVHLSSLLAAFVTEAVTTDLPALVRLETFDERLRLLPNPIATFAGVPIRACYSWCAGAAGYLVSRHGAEAILASREIGYVPIDEALFNPYQFIGKVFGVNVAAPGLCIQSHRLEFSDRSFRSSLSDDRSSRDADDPRSAPTRLLHATHRIIHRDIYVGTQKMWNEHIRGARKERVAFAN